MPFAQDLWDSFDIVSKKNKQGVVFSAKLQSFLDERVKLEQHYAKGIAKLCADKSYNGELEFGIMQQMFDTLKAETGNIGLAHQQLHDQLAALSQSVDLQLKARKKRSKAVVVAGDKMLSDLRAAENKLTKAKDKFEKQKKVEVKARDDFNRAREANNAKMLSKLTRVVEKETRSAEKSDQEYADAVKQAQEQQQRVYEAEMPRVLTDLESIEMEYINSTKDCLTQLTEAQAAVVPRVQSATTAMRSCADAIIPEQVVQAFCDANRTGNTQRPHAVYEPFEGPPGAAGRGAAMQQQQQQQQQQMMGVGRGGPMGGVGVPQGGMGRGRGAGPPVTQRPGAGPPGGPLGGPPGQQMIERCRALYDYDAQDANELSFKGGDVMTVLQKDESGWWQGELRGQIGMMPSNFVEALPPIKASVMNQPVTDGAPPYGGIAAAAAAGPVGGGAPGPGYAGPPKAARPPVGGVSVMGGPGPGGRGVGGGPGPGPGAGAGAGPSAGGPAPVEEVVADVGGGEAPAPSTSDAVGKRVRALYDYERDGDDEISLHEGDILTVEDDDAGWYIGMNPRGNHGRFPSNFTEVVE